MKSILENIKSSIEDLKWSSETKKQKALDLCVYIYNLYIYKGGDFNTYIPLSKQYFISVIKTKSYLYEIKDNLVNNGILEMTKSYDVSRKISKGYRFNNKLISGNYVALSGPIYTKIDDMALNGPKLIGPELKVSSKVNSNLYNLNNSIISNYNSDSLHICGPTMETYINKELQSITFKPEINDYINNFYIERKDIIINEDIEDEYVDIVFDNSHYRYKIDKAILLSKEQGLDLIKYKDRCYIDYVETFLIRKTNDLRLIFRKSIFDIENKIFRVSRNETNRRLDYNLTNMKSNLLDYILLDGEEIIELDISNAQFTMVSFLMDDIDEDFKKLSREGKLYDYVSNKLSIKKEEAKNKMFRVSFDKVLKNQDDIREIFPKTMECIDGYKNELGYKAFSNLSQNVESLVMIDGLLNYLISKEYDVLPIHDAVRVKKSQLDDIKNEILSYFNSINFKCLLRNKNDENKEKKESIKVKYKYKGYKEVEVEITKEDKELFKERVKDNESLSVLEQLNFMEIEKLTYLWNVYTDKNKIYQDNT